MLLKPSGPWDAPAARGGRTMGSSPRLDSSDVEHGSSPGLVQIQGQPGFHTEFQASQCCIVKYIRKSDRDQCHGIDPQSLHSEG